MFKKIAEWIGLSLLAFAMWFMLVYFGKLHNKDLVDLRKFTGPITSIYFERSSGKAPHYNLCFDFDDYKKLGVISTGSPYNGPVELYDQMRASGSMTVYYQPFLLNSTGKEVNVFQIQSGQQVLYSINTARHEYLPMIIISALGTTLITLFIFSKLYKIFHQHWEEYIAT